MPPSREATFLLNFPKVAETALLQFTLKINCKFIHPMASHYNPVSLAPAPKLTRKKILATIAWKF
jgi:hypothetical protein